MSNPKPTPETGNAAYLEDCRHWTRIALWLTGISLIPTAVTVLYAATSPGNIATLALAAIAILSTQGATTATSMAAVNPSGGEPSRQAKHAHKWARIAARCSFTVALAMVGSYLAVTIPAMFNIS